MECPFNKGTLYSIRNHVVLKNAEVDEFEGYFLKLYPIKEEEKGVFVGLEEVAFKR